MIRALLARKQVRFLLVGGWNTAFGFGAFATLYWATRPIELHWSVVWAVAQFLAVTNAYLGYKLLVFRTPGSLFDRYLRFWAAYSGLTALQFGLFFACVSLLHFPAIPSQVVVTAVSVLVGFLTHDRLTFRAWAAPQNG